MITACCSAYHAGVVGRYIWRNCAVFRWDQVLAVAQENERRIFAEADRVLLAPACDVLLLPIPEIVPLRLFACYVAKANGCDIDKPKNLAKSVTVE